MKVILTETQLKKIVEASTKEINAEANNTNLNPTDPQKEAGNYKMGHVSIKGMKISIENPRGSIRKFKKDDGTEGQVRLKNHYGYFGGTSGNGKDGDAVDVFIGPNPEGFERVYVIDQNNTDGEFDESKVMIGFDSKSEAKKAYFANFDSKWHGFRSITGVSIKLFKKWLYRRHKQRKPFSEYVEIQKKKLEEGYVRKPKTFAPFSKDDKIELVTDEPNLYDKEGNFKTSGNFPIKRNGQIFWVSRSMVVALYAFCKDENGEWCVLANKRRTGKWNVPQGYLDYGETAKIGAQRECEEETGIKIDTKYIKSIGNHEPADTNRSITERFVATLPGTIHDYSKFSTENAESGEVLDIKWIPLSMVDKFYWISAQNRQIKDVFGYSNNVEYSDDSDFSELVAKLDNMLNTGKISTQKYKKIKDILYLSEEILPASEKKNIVESFLTENIEKQLISESFSKYLYHYTTLDGLYKILSENLFILSPASETNRDFEMRNGYDNFLSFTRQHTNKVGYPTTREPANDWNNGLNVRLVFDGELLGNRHAGWPVNYHSKIIRKNKQQKAVNFDLTKLPQIRQSEDRLFSHDKEIKNISDYIIRIDILVQTKDGSNFEKRQLRYLHRIYTKAAQLKREVRKSNGKTVLQPVYNFENKIFLYDNLRDFNFNHELVNPSDSTNVYDANYKNAVIWTFYSPNIDCSLETQMGACKDFARNHGINIKERYFGGESQVGVFDEMCDYAANPKNKINFVLLYSYNQLRRDSNTYEQIKRLRRNNVKIINVSKQEEKYALINKAESSGKFSDEFLSTMKGQTSLSSNAKNQLAGFEEKMVEKGLANAQAGEIGLAAFVLAYVSSGPNGTENRIAKLAKKILEFMFNDSFSDELIPGLLDKALGLGWKAFFGQENGLQYFIDKKCSFIVPHIKNHRKLISKYQALANVITAKYGGVNFKRTLTNISKNIRKFGKNKLLVIDLLGNVNC